MPIHSWRLFEEYFTNTHCWFPICEKHDILKLSYSYPAEGLMLPSERSDSALHAELWSVLAVASLRDQSNSDHYSQADLAPSTPMQLYATAKAFIPDEIGNFDLGHVKAILNLAICNISQNSMGAAWLLVANASRIVDIMDKSALVTASRHRHVLHGCIMLDGLLALHFDRRPYFRKDEVRRTARIDEDGLDEWQPWTGSTNKASTQPRTPLLALSTLNAIPDIVALLANDDESNQDSLRRLQLWESSLPPKLAYAYQTSTPGPINPPAILLQAIYHCVSFRLTSSSSSLSRLLHILERAQAHVGWGQLPPVLHCLLTSLAKVSTGLHLSSALQPLLHKLLNTARAAWSKPRTQTQWPITRSPARDTAAAAHMSTPVSTTQPLQRPPLCDNSNVTQNPLGPSVSERSFEVLSPHADVLQTGSNSDQPDSNYPDVPSDLESFFDELASLDNTNNMGNQPQFMQNLGFAPDANMADLFSEYIPLQSTAFLSHDNSDAINLDHFGFYDGS
tara:strand:- start:7487 stop:9007 length:1521 start_codon:yes stop_codon:yes gene_type:complete